METLSYHLGFLCCVCFEAQGTAKGFPASALKAVQHNSKDEIFREGFRAKDNNKAWRPALDLKDGKGLGFWIWRVNDQKNKFLLLIP